MTMKRTRTREPFSIGGGGGSGIDSGSGGGEAEAEERLVLFLRLGVHGEHKPEEQRKMRGKSKTEKKESFADRVVSHMRVYAMPGYRLYCFSSFNAVAVLCKMCA